MRGANRPGVWCVLLACAAVCCRLAPGQQEPVAEVTFYSTPDFPRAEEPAYYGRFFGHLMDEGADLGWLARNRFVTFRMAPGQHEFSADNRWMVPLRRDQARLSMFLAAGRHYFISIYFWTPHPFAAGMMERSCVQAQRENRRTKPLDRKRLTEYGAASLVAESSFPACP